MYIKVTTMKIKTLAILFLICSGVFVTPVLSFQEVSITEDGTQFIAVPSDKNIIYSYETVIPTNGRLIFSCENNNTYWVEESNSIKFVTVNIKRVEETSIIDMLFWWL